MNLPTDKQYALRHGTTGRIWRVCEDGLWLFNTPDGIKRAWKTAKKAGLVNSEFSDHEIVTINLTVAAIYDNMVL